jgi:thiosulfate dehydrogenase (quinone) large subunit
MKNANIQQTWSHLQIFSLTLLRVLIGWHFLFEGFTKLLSSPAWSAKSYLLGSVGPFAPVFKALALNASYLEVVNFLNIWGLIIIGSGLFIGLFARPLKLAGIVLLALYYLAYPPFVSLVINAPVEGNYWIVNKNLIEMAALFALFMFPTSYITGIDRYFKKQSDEK